MLFTIKRALARNLGKNYELCKDAFEEGREQGRILLTKLEDTSDHKEAKKDYSEQTVHTVNEL